MRTKICILTTSYPKGGESLNEFSPGKFVHDMAKNLFKAGCDVHVITHHHEKTKANEKLDGVIIHRFHYFFPFWESLTKGPGIPENIKKIKNKLLVPFYFLSLALYSLYIIRKYNIDIINAHWVVPTGYIATWLKKITGKQLIITMYGAELFPILKGKMEFLRPFIKFAITRGDTIAGISKATVDAAKELSGRQDIRLIPDGVDVEYYKPGDKSKELLKKYKCFDENIVIFFTGYMIERKGHRYLLEAIKYVKTEVPKIKLILGGEGPLWKELNNLRTELNLVEFIEMPGFIPENELIPLLQSIDLFVLPSCIDQNGDTEGSATAALEAMACGIPAIISYVGGNIGSIEEGKGAYYFESSNVNDLTKKIMLLISDNPLYNKNKLLAREYIINNYTWKNCINKYLINSINV